MKIVQRVYLDTKHLNTHILCVYREIVNALGVRCVSVCSAQHPRLWNTAQRPNFFYRLEEEMELPCSKAKQNVSIHSLPANPEAMIYYYLVGS